MGPVQDLGGADLVPDHEVERAVVANPEAVEGGLLVSPQLLDVRPGPGSKGIFREQPERLPDPLRLRPGKAFELAGGSPR